MMRLRTLPLLACVLAVSGCPENSAPGNDREAALDAPEPPAPLANIESVVQGLQPSVMTPQAMTEADVRGIPAELRQCVFRFTKEGQPIVTYGDPGAVLKLNSKLAQVPATGDGRYGSAEVEMTMRAMEAGVDDGLVRTEFIFRVSGAPNELGFHGFSECGMSR